MERLLLPHYSKRWANTRTGYQQKVNAVLRESKSNEEHTCCGRAKTHNVQVFLISLVFLSIFRVTYIYNYNSTDASRNFQKKTKNNRIEFC